MNSFSIKDLESLSGVKAHTIRIWEQRYSFLKPQRTGTNIRYYTNEQLVKVLNIALLNKYGFKISHINKMKEEEIKEKLISLPTPDAQVEMAVNELIELMVTVQISEFEQKLDQHIASGNIAKTISQLIFPFLEKIGILWVTSNINTAQEHLVSNVIRQKLIMGIENVRPITIQNKTALLFLPEGEHHELALLYLYYILKSQGVTVYYLGANVPFKDLQFILDAKCPDVIYSHITAPPRNFNPGRFFTQISTQFRDYQFVIGGPAVQNYSKLTADNIQITNSEKGVMIALKSILFKQ